MSHREYYRPPDFTGPPQDSFPRQYDPRPDPPSYCPPPHHSPPSSYLSQPPSHHLPPPSSLPPLQYEEAAGSCGADWGNYGPDCDTEEYYGDEGQQWFPGRGYKRRKRRRFKRKKKYAFRCESCDKGFVEVESYDEHMSQHVECPHPNCTYLGSDKLVTMHWKFTHSEDSKQFNFKTPEDIEKWREERRKKYPKRENIEAKEEKEKKEPAPSSEPREADEPSPKNSDKSTQTAH